MELLFVLAIGAAVVAVVAKKWRMGGAFKEERAPRLLTSHAEIDDALPRKCPCGGHFHKEAEGPKRVGAAQCVRVVVACDKCERRRALLFTLSS